MTRTLTITRRAMGNSPGSELRLRGKWLHDLGFKPGMRVVVSESWSWFTGRKLSLRLLPRRDHQPKTKS